MKNVSIKDFPDEVLKPSYERPIIVMFHASWCGPCKTMKPIMDNLAQRLKFDLIGVDGGTETQLAESEGIRNVPTLIAFQDGKQVARLAGGQAEANVRRFLVGVGVGQGALGF